MSFRSGNVVRRQVAHSLRRNHGSLSFLVSSQRRAFASSNQATPIFRYNHLRHVTAFERKALRCFSSSSPVDGDFLTSRPVRILYGSQGGTAQIFGMQLGEALEEAGRDVTTMGLDEGPPSDMIDPDTLNIILTSVTGVGEPPDNAREWYQYIMSDEAAASDWNSVHFCAFGLGNSKAHPHHFNVIGKNVDERLEKLGATRVFDLGLGDDGECIDDDFDVWMTKLMDMLHGGGDASEPAAGDTIEDNEQDPGVDEGSSVDTEPPIASGRPMSVKYPALILQGTGSSNVTALPRENLLSTTFYAEDTRSLTVQDNRVLNTRSADYGLHELVMEVDQPYEAGDHFAVYPQNSYALVEAYLNHVFDGIDPYTVIEGSEAADASSSSYPFPRGLTLLETLLHCVDLNAVPSPSVSREVLGRKDVNYKNDVAIPRRTLLDLCIEANGRQPIEDLLFNMMTPMQPRYYSIASSPLVHPSQVYLTYRPVKYVTSHGSLRQGTCTSHLLTLGQGSRVVGSVRSNPTFRLPKDPNAPVLLLAGGCGVAPIRAFLEERMHEIASGATFGEAHLFLGFRSPHDEVYRDMVEEALRIRALTNVHVSFTLGCENCGLVSDTVRQHGELVWNLLEHDGGYLYLCGGARTFGAAIEREVIQIIQEYGPPSMKEEEEQAMQYLRDRIKEGRFCEDLAD